MGLIQHIRGPLVYLDANLFIYFLDDAPDYAAYVEPLFQALDVGALRGLSSEISLAESMVKPLREGDADHLAAYQAMFQGTAYLLFGSCPYRGGFCWMLLAFVLKCPSSCQMRYTW